MNQTFNKEQEEFSLSTYRQEVTATEREDYQTPADRLENNSTAFLLHSAMDFVDKASNTEGPLKKHIFYGKELSVPLKEEPKDFKEVSAKLQCRNVARLLHAAMGFVDEANEFQVALKKHLFDGEELDTVNLKEELGDLLWYLTIALDALDSSYEEIGQMNLKKLRNRYQAKFSEEKALNRNTDEERKVLENSQS